jgi:tetratricopeptide (TPR) repeat protein
MAAETISDQAALALRLAMEDPARAEVLASEALEAALQAGMPEAQSSALRALGLAVRSRGDMPVAIGHLDRAVVAAEQASTLNLAAEARMSLAATLAFAGDGVAALATLDAARASEPTATAVASQRAGILTLLGRHDEALEAYRPVIPALRRIGDRAREGRALNNRGLLYVAMGRLAQAEADLARAERLEEEVGNLVEAARYRHNRGVVAARGGDLPTALRLLEEADQRCRGVGVEVGIRALGRAEVLLRAGLLRESQLTASQAVAELLALGNRSDAVRGLAMLADIFLLSGDAAESRSAGEQAVELGSNQPRSGWQAVSMAAVARASLVQGHGDAALALLATEAAEQLADLGFAAQATMAHAVAGRLWLAAGELDAGLAELSRSATGRYRGTAASRLAAWEAEANRRLALGNRRGAMVALRCAMSVVEDQQSSFGATELRANVAVHAGQAASLGLRLALQTKRPTCILQWMERGRANSLRLSPARPPREETFASQLAELRRISQEIDSCVTTGSDPRALVALQTALERQIRERAWQTEGSGRRVPPDQVGERRHVIDALGDAALVEMAEIDGWLHAVVMVKGVCSHRRLAAAIEVQAEVTHLRLAIRRLAYGGAATAFGSGAGEQLDRAAARLDRLLLAPIARLVGSRSVVIVPTGELHAAPWGALPTLAGRPVSVAPSARLWLAAELRRRNEARASGELPARLQRVGATVVVAGPGLSGARREAEALRSRYPAAQVLTGPKAGVARALRAFEGAELAHVAAHASFRGDNALWSSLQLADGPLTVYELERLGHPPGIVVLSACQSGLSTVRPGDEIMGLVAALLGLGTRCVVASVVPVDDAAAEGLMLGFHDRLAAGDGPARALAAAGAGADGSVGAAFACYGAG